jgi:hypothetical protein
VELFQLFIPFRSVTSVGKASFLDMLSDFGNLILNHWQQPDSHYSLTVITEHYRFLSLYVWLNGHTLL